MALKAVGSLWKKTKGKKTYLTGVLDLGALGQVNVGIFPNDQKEEKQPDYRIVRFENGENGK